MIKYNLGSDNIMKEKIKKDLEKLFDEGAELVSLIASGKNLTNAKICNIQKMFLKNSSMPYPIGEYRSVPVFIRHDGEMFIMRLTQMMLRSL